MRNLYGREVAMELARVRAEQAWAGEGSLVLFTGESGIGKSSLIEHVASFASAKDVPVVWGRCWEAGGAPAYWPWIQIFRGLGVATALFNGTVHDLAGGAESARFHTFGLAVQCLMAAAGRRPLVLVLDDLHAADVSSLLLLLLLAREVRATRVLVLGAYRDSALAGDLDSASLVAKIAREALVVPLVRLMAEDMRYWLRDVQPETTDASAALLYSLTEGHPLVMCEALRLGAAAGTPFHIADGLRGVLDERLARLPERVRLVLASASILGREFLPAEVATTGALAPDDVHEGLREAMTGGIVVTTSTTEKLAFSHMLLRDRLYAELLPSTRVKLHWKAGLAKMASGAGPEAVVHHLLEGYGAGDPLRLAEVARAAAEVALGQLAFEDAMRIAERAVNLVEPDLAPGRELCELRLILAEAATRTGATTRGKELAFQAADLADQIAAADLVARAALVFAIDRTSGEVDPRMVALLRRGLAGLSDEDSPLRARVTARLAVALMPPSSEHGASEILILMRESTAMARRLCDGHTLLYVLQWVASGGLMLAEQERLGLLQETMLLAHALDQRLVLLATFGSYITTLLAVGKRADAEAAIIAYDTLLAAFPEPQHQFRLRLVQALVAGLNGDMDGAMRIGNEARLLSARADVRAGVWLWAMHRFSVAQISADPAAVGGDASQILALFGTSTSLEHFAPWLLAGMGRRDEAAATLRASRVHPRNLVGVLGAAETCALLGERELAAHYYGLLRSFSDRMFWSIFPGALLGPTARTLGDLALLMGRVPDALRHYDEAIQFCELLRAPRLEAECRRRRDAALCEVGHDGPVAESQPAARLSISRRIDLTRQGDVWTIRYGDSRAFPLKHSKGLHYLAILLETPEREVHVFELAGIEHRTGDAGPALDARSKEAYRTRLEDLREELGESERFEDRERARRAQDEIDAIAEQLAGAVGLGNRDRRLASDSERARINVQRRLKDAIDRIGAVDQDLARHLTLTVKTGTFCVYAPI